MVQQTDIFHSFLQFVIIFGLWRTVICKEPTQTDLDLEVGEKATEDKMIIEGIQLEANRPYTLFWSW